MASKRDICYMLDRVVTSKLNIFPYWSTTSRLKVNNAMDINEQLWNVLLKLWTGIYVHADVSLYSLGARLSAKLFLLHALTALRENLLLLSEGKLKNPIACVPLQGKRLKDPLNCISQNLMILRSSKRNKDGL